MKIKRSTVVAEVPSVSVPLCTAVRKKKGVGPKKKGVGPADEKAEGGPARPCRRGLRRRLERRRPQRRLFFISILSSHSVGFGSTHLALVSLLATRRPPPTTTLSFNVF